MSIKMEREMAQLNICPYNTNLHGSEIRLLQVKHEHSNGDSRVVTCTQKIVDLDELPLPEFCAISYACGAAYSTEVWDQDKLVKLDDGEHEDIPDDPNILFLCDGVKIHTHRTAYTALTAFEPVATQQWFWIDALCIKQGDTAEKASQIQLMSKIYSSSLQTLIYLGHERQFVHGTTNEVFDLIETLVPEFQGGRLKHRIPFESWFAATTTTHELAQWLHMDDLPRKMFLFAEFCGKCRWFRRLWCWQELALATQPHIRCGKRYMPWKSLGDTLDLILAFRWTDTLGTHPDVTGVTPGRTNCFLNVIQMHLARQNLQQSRIGGTVEQVVSLPQNASLSVANVYEDGKPGRIYNTAEPPSKNRDAVYYELAYMLDVALFGCKDDRDRVYGIFGALNVHCPDALSSCISVSYSKPVIEVYMGIWTYLLQASNNLDLIALQTPSARDSTWPCSWLVDLRLPFNITAVCTKTSRSLYNASKGIHEILNPQCHAARTFDVFGSKIRVFGGCFDTVVDTIKFDLESALESLKNLAERWSRKSSSKCSLRLIWRTLVRDDWNYGEDIEPTLAFGYFCSFLTYQSLLSATTSIEQAQVSLKNTLGLFQHESPPEESAYLAIGTDFLAFLTVPASPSLGQVGITNKTLYSTAQCEKAIQCHSPWRQLAITERGILCDCPSGARIGDEIWPLDGANAPMVLRRTVKSDEYLFVGDIFMADYMHGEMLDKQYGLKKRMRHIYII